VYLVYLTFIVIQNRASEVTSPHNKNKRVSYIKLSTLHFLGAEKRLFLNKSKTKFHKLFEGQARPLRFLGLVVGEATEF